MEKENNNNKKDETIQHIDGMNVNSPGQESPVTPPLATMTIKELIEDHCGPQQAQMLLENVTQQYHQGLRGPSFRGYVKQIAENM